MRDVFILDENNVPVEKPFAFNERTGNRLHVYPNQPCVNCGFYMFAVACHEPDKGEAWCLCCGADDPN